MKLSSFVLVATFISAFAQADLAEKHWREQNLSTQFLTHPLFLDVSHKTVLETGERTWVSEKSFLSPLDTKSCYAKAKTFRACIEALSTFAAFAKEPHGVVPTSILKNKDYPAVLVKDFGGLAVVKYLKRKGQGEFTREQIREDIEQFRYAAEDLRGNKRLKQISMPDVLAFLENEIVDKEKIYRAVPMAWSSYMQSFDPHARLSTKSETTDRMENSSEDSYAGIGVQINIFEGRVLIQIVFEGSPGADADLRAGDLILSIDGQNSSKLASDEVISRIRGPEGSVVTLELERNGEKLIVPVKRGSIKSENVSSKLIEYDQNEKIGFIRLQQFSDSHACDKIASILKEWEVDPSVNSMILDLRANPGGNISQALCMGGLFLGSNIELTYLKSVSKNGPKGSTPYRTEAEKVFSKPLGILQNGQSASGSELLAGGLQDYKRAWVGGRVSFGKGSAQGPMNVYLASEDGKDRIATPLVVWSTLALFYQPSERTNQLVGIIPNFVLPETPETVKEPEIAREVDLYPNAYRPERELDWIEYRKDAVSNIEQCRAGHQAKARSSYQAQIAEGKKADYQLLQMLDIMHCHTSLGL